MKLIAIKVNLPQKYKMVEPVYQTLTDKEMPRASQNGVHVKVILGESMGKKSLDKTTKAKTYYLDFKVDPNSSFSQPIPKGWNALVYVLAGTGIFGSTKKEVAAQHTIFFGTDGDSIEFTNTKSEPLQFVLLAGEPLNEPGKK